MMSDFATDSTLVLLDTTPAGALAASAAGLLGAAASIGTPVAVVVSAPERREALAAEAAALGAAVVLVADAAGDALTVPVGDSLSFSHRLLVADGHLDPASVRAEL